MSYDCIWAQAHQAQGFLYFYGHKPNAEGKIEKTCFSQWWQKHPFEVDGILYRTAEHYMMAAKARLFKDELRLRLILEAKHPSEAKELGRQVENFDPSIWLRHRFEWVVAGNLAKFSQHQALKDFLLQTQDLILVEASPSDCIWGIGLSEEAAQNVAPKDWEGENLLGFALMEVRDVLKAKD